MSNWLRLLILFSPGGISQTTGAGGSLVKQPTSANTPVTQYFRNIPQIGIQQFNPFAINDFYKSGESGGRPGQKDRQMIFSVILDHIDKLPLSVSRNQQGRLEGPGLACFGKWAQEQRFESKARYSLRALERSLDLLTALNGKGRRVVVRAVTAVAVHDNRVTTAETELIRTVCASLDIPLPLLIAGRWDESE